MAVAVGLGVGVIVRVGDGGTAVAVAVFVAVGVSVGAAASVGLGDDVTVGGRGVTDGVIDGGIVGGGVGFTTVHVDSSRQEMTTNSRGTTILFFILAPSQRWSITYGLGAIIAHTFKWVAFYFKVSS